MTATIQFVDSIASSPTVRLDLNDGTTWVVNQDADFSPPPLRRSIVSTLLRDGEYIAAGAYANRTIVLPLELVASTPDLALTATQALWRELNRTTNILKVQFGTVPVFFRTFRAPDTTLEFIAGRIEYQNIPIEITAEPFALGLKETTGALTVSNDPAAATRPCYMDITGVKGDVLTPAQIMISEGSTSQIAGDLMVVAIRRHGTPSSVTWLLQAEAMTLGTDATLPGNDSGMSGAGSNYVRIGFSTATMAERIGISSWPSSTDTNANQRGTYRVFARVRRNAVGVVRFQLRYGLGSSVVGDTVTIPDSVQTTWVDLGLVSFPTGSDPIYDGYDTTEMPMTGTHVNLYAERISGASLTPDVDCFLFLPADEEMCIVRWSTFAPLTTGYFVLDGPTDIAYSRYDATHVQSNRPISRSGSIPQLAPNQTNRLFILANCDEQWSAVISDGLDVTVNYWPRYLMVPGS